jgi:serine/threonine protein kinase/tetratricopeptide (TPR) repeat protein
MKCPKCQFENPSDTHFCGNCAAPLKSSDEVAFSQTETLQTPRRGLTFGSIFAQKYKIIEELGRGGMGVVYKAEDTKLKRTVALKFLPHELTQDLEARERFVHEAQAASQLDHPNICTIHEIDETEDGQIWIAMAFYKGESLRERIKREPLNLEEAIDIAFQMAQGLARAYDQGIVHRDIKPANIMITVEGLIKIVDFGLAKLARTTRITKAGTTMGTAAYMSPEQARGEDVDERTDIWSLGVVLYEMVSGQLPFKGDREQAIIYSILNENPEPIKGVPAELERIIQKALAKNPAERYQNCHEFIKVLGHVEELLGEKTLRRVSVRKKPRRQKWLSSPIFWAMVVILVGLAASLLLFFPSKKIPFSERGWILITDFENQTGDGVFDRSLNTALTVSLQQSRYVNVFPRARVKETFQRMGRKDPDRLDEELGREVALREGIRALVTCSISQIGTMYTLTASVIDPNTQVALKTETMQARGRDEVLSVLNDLSGKIRKDLGESLKNIKQQSLGLPRATTSSLEALKNYTEARRASGNEAEALYQKAIEFDPDFAMAHAGLGALYYWANDRVKGEEHFKKALSLLGRLTERERLLIQATVPAFRGNRDEATTQYKVYLSKYPDDSNGWFNLGHNYLMLSRNDESIDAFMKSLKIYPNQPTAYINIASCLSMMGRYQEAVDNYLKAFKLDPELLTYGNLNHEFGFTYVEMGEFQKAQEAFEKMLRKGDDQKARGHRSLALLNMCLGKHAIAIDHLKESILLNKTLKYWLSELRDRLFLAVVYREKGKMEAFDQELRQVQELLSKNQVEPWWVLLVGKIYARLGKIKQANDLLKEISSRMIEGNRSDQAAFNILKGEIEMSKTNYTEAINLFEMAYKMRNDNYPLESVAYGYFKKGDLDQAIAKYELLISKKDSGWEAQEYWILAHYQLAKIYEIKGDREKSTQSYQRFLDVWKEADKDLAALVDAKKRLAELQN